MHVRRHKCVVCKKDACIEEESTLSVVPLASFAYITQHRKGQPANLGGTVLVYP